MGCCCISSSSRSDRYKPEQHNRNVGLSRPAAIRSSPASQTNYPNTQQGPVSPRVMSPPSYGTFFLQNITLFILLFIIFYLGDANRNAAMSSVPMVRAIFNYSKKYDDDISFGKGERLQLVNRYQILFKNVLS